MFNYLQMLSLFGAYLMNFYFTFRFILFIRGLRTFLKGSNGVRDNVFDTLITIEYVIGIQKLQSPKQAKIIHLLHYEFWKYVKDFYREMIVCIRFFFIDWT